MVKIRKLDVLASINPKQIRDDASHQIKTVDKDVAPSRTFERHNSTTPPNWRIGHGCAGTSDDA